MARREKFIPESAPSAVLTFPKFAAKQARVSMSEACRQVAACAVALGEPRAGMSFTPLREAIGAVSSALDAYEAAVGVLE
jgi:hypothetical protein